MLHHANLSYVFKHAAGSGTIAVKSHYSAAAIVQIVDIQKKFCKC
jgi:hypothetical protein